MERFRTFNVNLSYFSVDWFGVTVNADGDVFGCGTYLTSDESQDIEIVEEFFHDGTTNTIIISPGGVSVLYDPRGMAFDAVGQLYVADTLNYRVVKLSPPTVAANPPSPSGSNPVAVSATLTGLMPNTTYYARAVVVGRNGSLVGATQSFTTPDAPPIFTNVDNATFAVGQSNSFTFAASGNPVFSESGALPAGVSLSATGILSGVPSVAGTFPITVTASNGLSYATQNFTLTVVNLRPALLTPVAYYVKASTATLEAVVTSGGASPVTQLGFLYAPTAVNPNPTVGGNGVTELDSPNPSSTFYQVQVNSLTPSTQYSLVAFAVNSYGTAYSTVTNFTTLPGPVGSLVVNTLLDVTNTPGLNSLRDAINYAYALNDVATITFDPSLFANGPGTLVLTNGLNGFSGGYNALIIQGLGGKLTLRGPGPNLLTISGSDQSPIFNNSGPDVELDNLTLAHGSGPGGGAITSDNNLTCSNVVFASNSAGNGGAIWSGGPLTLYNCTFTNNLSTGYGGAVSGYKSMTIAGSTFANNRCGIDSNGNTNAYGGLGGAIYGFLSGYPFQMVNTTIAGNHAYNGNGGALELNLGTSSSFIADSTITGNTADGFGGGIDANFSLPLNNSIISGNFAATNSNVNASAGYTATNSLIGADAAAIFGGNPLANNGGLTPTIALNPTGPAVNAGNNALIPAGITTDQRGQPRVTDSIVDIGAFEYQYQYTPPDVVTWNTNGLGWALNGDTVNGGPRIANNVFTPTDNTASENRSAWFRFPLYIGGFHAAFTYRDVYGNGADGTAFVIQNSPAGFSALGNAGGSLGYVGVNNSVALMMNLYAGAPGGPSGWLVATNGAGNGGGYSSPDYQTTSPVNLDAGNPVQVDLLYSGGILSIQFRDLATGDTYQSNVPIDISSFTGTNQCWVGFTGSEAGFLSYQTVSNFVYQAFEPPVISGPATATFVTGLSNSVSFSATGNPSPTFLISGNLPAGLSLSADGLLSGIIPDGFGGSYPISIIASNGAMPNATLSLTLQVVEADTLKAHPNFNTNGLGWALNGDSVNGGPNIANNTFTLTDATGGENRSAWFRYPLYVVGFQASFTYQDIGDGGADGTAFVIQNSSAGTSAIGAGGGGLAYIGITPSVAVMLDIYGGAPGGPSGVLVATNGNGDGAGYWPSIYQSTAPVNLDAGNPINVNVLYLNGVLKINCTDTVTSSNFTTLVPINIASFVGTNAAWVGITGSEGGVLSHQIVSNFTFTPMPTLAASGGQSGSLVLTWPATAYGFMLEVNSSLNNPSGWTPVAATVTQTNGLNTVVVPSLAGTQFYRLQLP